MKSASTLGTILSKTRLTLFVAGALLLGACQSGGGSSGNTGASCGSGTQPTIYMIGSTTNSTFWQALSNGFLQGAKDFCMRGVYSAPLAHTNTDEIALLQSALAAKPAGVAINYVDHTIYKSTIQALDQGAAVVIFNNNRFEELNNDPSTATTDPRVTNLAYVGQDEHKSGVVLATALLSQIQIPAGKRVVWFPVIPTHPVIHFRGLGLKQVLDAKNIPMDLLQSPGPPGQEGLDETQNEAVFCSYIQAHKDTVGAIFGTSITSTGAAKCLQKINLHIPIGEFDVDLESAQDIQSGWITLAVDQQPFWQGYLAALNLAYKIRFKLQPFNADTGTLVVSKDNVADVIYQIQNGKG